jgi:2-polyprenyl-3-methyl-5-hydroxy-6-metoxy-1,4-benzoquinol methylase
LKNTYCILCKSTIPTEFVGVVDLQRQNCYALVFACHFCEFIFFGSGYVEDDQQMKNDLEYCIDHSEAIRANSLELLSKLNLQGSELRVLDIGCGAGYFVEAAQKAGLQAHGIDINPFCIQYARETLGLDHIHHFLFD